MISKAVSIIGSGRSSVFLIEYLATYCQKSDIPFAVYDRDTDFIKHAINPDFYQYIHLLDVSDESAIESVIAKSQLVVSMLPAFMHPQVATLCLKHKVNMATASYVSDAMKQLNQEVRESNLIFMNEVGLDPGIDHMSAMKIMDDLRRDGAIIKGFKSYCGGLVADEDDGDNPWKYKFSWNPRNVVLAAQGQPAQYLENGKLKIKPYQQIFRHPESCNIHGYGQLEAYPNRDSLQYVETYGLHDVDEMVRGTFRKTGYCSAWQVFVELGMTDDSLVLHLPADCSMSDWMDMYLPESGSDLKGRLKNFLNLSDEILAKLEWLDLFTMSPLPLTNGTSAQILEEILKSKWVLGKQDRDLVVMLHQITYAKGDKKYLHESTLVIKGESNTHTAMAKTVGLPLAISCKLILENSIQSKGVLTPVKNEIYSPILDELSQYGIQFKDQVVSLS
ncbi:MAG: saccharopine dehydrogenase family protein [Chitinophagaceae bacterium]